MNPQEQELFDLAILRVLDANRTRYGLGSAAIGHLLTQYGFGQARSEDLLDRIEVLQRKALVEEVAKLIGAANRAWRITDKGIGVVDDRNQ
jgi:hypothetical protein